MHYLTITTIRCENDNENGKTIKKITLKNKHSKKF